MLAVRGGFPSRSLFLATLANSHRPLFSLPISIIKDESLSYVIYAVLGIPDEDCLCLDCFVIVPERQGTE